MNRCEICGKRIYFWNTIYDVSIEINDVVQGKYQFHNECANSLEGQRVFSNILVRNRYCPNCGANSSYLHQEKEPDVGITPYHYRCELCHHIFSLMQSNGGE